MTEMKRLLIASLLFLFAAGSASAPVADAYWLQKGSRCQPVGGPKAEAGDDKTSAVLRRDFKSPLPIAAGEKLVYEIKLSRFPIYATVGNITFEFVGPQTNPALEGVNVDFRPKEDDRLIRLHAEAVSKGLLVRLFNLNVNDRFETLVDARDFGARLTFKELEEGKRHTRQTAVFDREHQSVKYTIVDVNKPQAPAQEKTLTVEDGTLDLLSAFYFLRLQKLKEGEVVRFPVSHDAENYPFEVVIGKREKLKTELGKFRTLKVEPKLFGPGRIFTRPGEMTMWVTDDERHTPVRLVAKTVSGTITATLVKAEGAKAEAGRKKKRAIAALYSEERPRSHELIRSAKLNE